MSCGEEHTEPVKNGCGGYYYSEEVGHIDCQCSPGMTVGGITFKELPNALGGTYWKATQNIESVFGASVDGEISAVGKSKEHAAQNLEIERKKMNESLWA